jgi:hypothetical protein
LTVSSNRGAWLVAVVSLLSSWTEVLPRPVISTPKLAAGEAIQDCTCAVTSTSRNEFATEAVVDPNVAPIDGWLL